MSTKSPRPFQLASDLRELKWPCVQKGQREGNYDSDRFRSRTLRYSLRRVSPLDSVNCGLITQRSVVQIHPPQPNLSSHASVTCPTLRELHLVRNWLPLAPIRIRWLSSPCNALVGRWIKLPWLRKQGRAGNGLSRWNKGSRALKSVSSCAR